MNGSTSRNAEAVSQYVDTDSRTEDADFSQYIDKQSPIKVDDIEKIESGLGSPGLKVTPSKQAHIQQTQKEAHNKKRLAQVRDEEALNRLKQEAIQQKKELRQKRLNFKKQVQMEED